MSIGLRKCVRCGEVRPCCDYASPAAKVCDVCRSAEKRTWSRPYMRSEDRRRNDALIGRGEERTARYIEKPQNLLRVLQKIEAGNYAKA